MEYVTETNVGENEVVIQSIVQTHIANMLYSLLMLETGYQRLDGKEKMNNYSTNHGKLKRLLLVALRQVPYSVTHVVELFLQCYER